MILRFRLYKMNEIVRKLKEIYQIILSCQKKVVPLYQI